MSNSIPKRNRNIHSWSIRGINSQEKWDAIRSKIMESNYDVVGLRKTKTLLMLSILENSAPQDLIVLISIWEGRKFSGQAIFQNDFAQNVEFHCTVTGASWILTNIYATCTPEEKLLYFGMV
jgi:hypothetical protein